MEKKSRWHIYDNEIAELIQEHQNNIKVAKIILKTNDSIYKNKDLNLLRTYVKRFRTRALKNASSVVDLEALQNYLLSNKQVNAKFREINFNDNINAAHIAYLYRIEILIQQKLLNATQDFDPKLNKMVEDEILDAIKISRTQ